MVQPRRVSAAALGVLLAFTARAEPAALVEVPEGDFVMGRDLGGHDDEHPAHRVHVAAFTLDATLVTVAEFRAFADSTHFATSAERLGYGMVATEGLAEWEWVKTPGASWRAPFGSAPVAIADDWPVTMVSWADANAYCRAQGRRLPTEAEWEYAMRAGVSTRFPWGDSPVQGDGGVGLNYWQGPHTQSRNTDGYLYLSPVRAFAPNALGLYDPVGNLWQWVADWYADDAYRHPAPLGPASGTRKVARGGSWWCSKHTCTGYGLFARGKTVPDAPFNNNGFRCASNRRAAGDSR